MAAKRPVKPSSQAASTRMKAVRRKGTAPELVVASLLRRLGHKVTRNVKSLVGSPDFVLADASVAIFVHGCFWHRHSRCRYATSPKKNRAFWAQKFLDNQSRDRRVAAQLRRQGFRVLTVWECQTRRVGLDMRMRRYLGGTQ